VRIVVALGGNAIAHRGDPLDPEHQVARVRVAAQALAQLAGEHSVVVTHGNGPQVGMLAAAGEGLPLDVAGAESEGMIGYWIDQELGNLLPDRDVAALLTQVEVNPSDPAFKEPTKPIGRVYDEATAKPVDEEIHLDNHLRLDDLGFRGATARQRIRGGCYCRTTAHGFEKFTARDPSTKSGFCFVILMIVFHEVPPAAS